MRPARRRGEYCKTGTRKREEEDDISDRITDSDRRFATPRWLSIESRPDGLAVQGPHFYVWDREEESALAWAADLHAAAPDDGAPHSRGDSGSGR